MISQAFTHDIGSYLAALCGGYTTATTAGTGDNTEVDGPYLAVPQGAKSCAVWLLHRATLGAAETLALLGNLQDAADGSGTGVADYGTALSSTTAQTGAATNGLGITKLGDFNLAGARSHLRVQFTPNLSASGTDTAHVMAVVVFGGVEELPAT